MLLLELPTQEDGDTKDTPVEHCFCSAFRPSESIHEVYVAQGNQTCLWSRIGSPAENWVIGRLHFLLYTIPRDKPLPHSMRHHAERMLVPAPRRVALVRHFSDRARERSTYGVPLALSGPDWTRCQTRSTLKTVARPCLIPCQTAVARSKGEPLPFPPPFNLSRKARRGRLGAEPSDNAACLRGPSPVVLLLRRPLDAAPDEYVAVTCWH